MLLWYRDFQIVSVSKAQPKPGLNPTLSHVNITFMLRVESQILYVRSLTCGVPEGSMDQYYNHVHKNFLLFLDQGQSHGVL